MITRPAMPVASSTSSTIVISSTMSSYLTFPLTSVNIGEVYGSHLTKITFLSISCSSAMDITEPEGTVYFSSSRPLSSFMLIWPLRFKTIVSPDSCLTVLRLWYLIRPLNFDFINDCSTILDAVPPIWNVRIVS